MSWDNGRDKHWEYKSDESYIRDIERQNADLKSEVHKLKEELEEKKQRVECLERAINFMISATKQTK